MAGRAVGLPAAKDDIADLVRVDLGVLLQESADAMRDLIVGTRQVERTAEGLGERGSERVNDNGFTHNPLVSRNGQLPCKARPNAPLKAGPQKGIARVELELGARS